MKHPGAAFIQPVVTPGWTCKLAHTYCFNEKRCYLQPSTDCMSLNDIQCVQSKEAWCAMANNTSYRDSCHSATCSRCHAGNAHSAAAPCCGHLERYGKCVGESLECGGYNWGFRDHAFVNYTGNHGGEVGYSTHQATSVSHARELQPLIFERSTAQRKKSAWLHARFGPSTRTCDHSLWAQKT